MKIKPRVEQEYGFGYSGPPGMEKKEKAYERMSESGIAKMQIESSRAKRIVDYYFEMYKDHQKYIEDSRKKA